MRLGGQPINKVKRIKHLRSAVQENEGIVEDIASRTCVLCDKKSTIKGKKEPVYNCCEANDNVLI